MASFVAVSQAEAIAWVCFIVGIVLLVGGVSIGIWISLKLKQETEQVKNNVIEANARFGVVRGVLAESREGVYPTPEATAAVDAAEESAEAAKSALENVQGILAALPENVRFAGLLILVGTVLMSVATVQFGGISLF